MKEMQAKFRHIVLYKECDEIKFHVPDPDNIALDLTEEQQEAYAELVAKHGAHQEHAQATGQESKGGQGQCQGQGGTTTGQESKPNSPPEPTETSYLALAELSKEWDVVPSSVYEVRGCAVRCASLSAVLCARLCFWLLAWTGLAQAHTVASSKFSLHLVVPKGREGAEPPFAVFLENTSAKNRLELPKGSLLCRMGAGEIFAPDAPEASQPNAVVFAAMPLTSKLEPGAAILEKDAVVLYRDAAAPEATLMSVEDVLKKQDILMNGVVWGHTRTQPQRGPRKLTATKAWFVPTHVPLRDLTLDSVGQVCRAATLSSSEWAVAFEVKLKEHVLEPVNHSNLAAIVARKKVMLQCLKLTRVA